MYGRGCAGAEALALRFVLVALLVYFGEGVFLVAKGFRDGSLHLGLLGFAAVGEGLVDDGQLLRDVFLYIQGVLLSADAERLADSFVYLLQ